MPSPHHDAHVQRLGARGHQAVDLSALRTSFSAVERHLFCQLATHDGRHGIHSDFQSVLLVAVKEMYGSLCLIGTFVLLLMLLYDVQPVRSTMSKMPKLSKLGKIVKKGMV